jgi:sugar fermentation stimulation protein A
LFTVQRGDAESLSPADAIDPEYGRLLRLAMANGVEALAYRADISMEQIYLTRQLPVIV